MHEPVPDLKEPHAFIMIRPWVDVGSVATITLARLEQHFGAKELGKLARPGNFFDFTRYRPTLYLVEGNRRVKVPNSAINYAQPDGGPDLVFFHLMEPHAFGEDYAESVLEVLKSLHIKRYCRLGAMYDAVPHTRPIRVTGDIGKVPTRWNPGNLKGRGRPYQGPTSIMNLVSEGVPNLGLEIDTINFMVHLPQYLQVEEDYAGAARLIEVLSSIYDLPPDLSASGRGEQQYDELNKAVERNPELKSLIQRMEAQYDADETSSTGDSPSTPLSPEVERFLQEMGQRFNDPQGGNGPNQPG